MKAESGRFVLACSLALAVLSCAGETGGLRKTPPGDGPQVKFDLDARPIPEIPLPNDIATRPDPTSVTGRRVNVSLLADTGLEQKIRQKINTLDGFGTFAAISVSFDKPLDLENIRQRHLPQYEQFEDDAVLVMNIDPRSPAYGQPVPLDLGNGNFPIVLEREDNYFSNDPRSGISNLLFDTVEEDTNHNGIMDPGEDTDDDGVLDHPNLYRSDGDQYRDLVDFYEKETDTIIIRPLIPLEPESEYAVVLTDRLIGENGQPVRSPFLYVNHLSQTERLKELGEIFQVRHDEYGLGIENIAFAWTFTTQSTTRGLNDIRDGLYGQGLYAELAGEFPPRVEDLLPLFDSSQKKNNMFIIDSSYLTTIIRLLIELFTGWDESYYGPFLDTYKNVDYVAMGVIETPNFLENADEVILEDPETGRAPYGRHKVYFTLFVPKPTELHGPPFPVAFYSHGYTSSRLEAFGFAGSLARFGIATIGIDAYGHGTELSLDAESEAEIKEYLEPFHLVPMLDALRAGRARDLDCDGEVESGGDFWTADTFHTRDVVRQSIIDYMAIIRVFRAFDGAATWRFDVNDDAQRELAGDFNADGVVDIGGAQNDYFITGISLGGILAMILPGVEPAITAAAPVSGGGGLADIGIRSTQGGVVEAVFLKIFGPIVVGLPDQEGLVVPAFDIYRVNDNVTVPFARPRRVEPGTRVRLTNLRSGAFKEARAKQGGLFRLSLAADWGRAEFPCETDRPETAGGAGNPLLLEFLSPDGNTVLDRIDRFEVGSEEQPIQFYGRSYRSGDPLVSLVEGFGHQRATPSLRRFMTFAQLILERGDPINYAPDYLANVLIINTVGDMNVPINTGIAQARAAGIIPWTGADSRYSESADRVLVENYVVEGLEKLRRFADDPRFMDDREILMDADNLSEGGDGFDAPRLDPPLRLEMTRRNPTSDEVLGVSGVRFAYLNPRGQHGFAIPDPDKAFDMDTYLINLIGYYFATGGKTILDDVCLEDYSCSFFQSEFPSH